MRLKKLTLQAFGPFKDKVVIDFEDKKIDKGLLLISGDTGSGKTTIFDAICFALYGKTSGENRETDSLKSDWAAEEIEPYVDLEFYYKNKFYEVKRIPSYFRKKKNSDELVKTNSKAELNINGNIVTKLKDVESEIDGLIGLDYNQFRQVAMLSQGEFTKFLLAKSQDKTTIFRKIFGTELYENLQTVLKQDEKDKKDQIESVNKLIDAEKNNIKDIIDLTGLNEEEMIDELDTKINKDSEKVNETKEARDKKNEEQTKLSTELSILTELNDKISKYNEASKNLDELISSNPHIDEEKEKYDYNIKIANTIFSLLEKIDKDSETLKTKKLECAKNKEELDTKNNEYKEKEEKFNDLDQIPGKIEELTNEINEISKKNEDYGRYIAKNEELKETQEKCKTLYEKHKKQNDLFEKMRQEYYLDVSVEIAERLEDGKPCPVCGSIEHPKTATAAESEYTKEDLEKCEKKLKDIEKKRNQKEGEIEEIKKTINEYEIPEDIDVHLELKKNIKLLEEKNEEKEKLDKEFKQLSKEKEELSGEIEGLRKTLDIFKQDIGGLEGKIEEYNNDLNKFYEEHNTNYEEYESKKIDANELDELNRKISEFDKNKITFETTIKSLEKEAKDKEIVDVSEKEEELKEITKEFNELDKAYTDLNTIVEQLKSSTDNIKEYLKEKNKMQIDYDIIKVLNDTANGSLAGKQKITFENYVQSYFMQSVLAEANKRLVKMTDSRYELKRKETEAKKSGKTGLDFSIFDSHTGKERDVTTLSGGEKFKASLALALGMSDTISNKSGGIKLDSVFIDEGFGSLDDESLNQALNILYDISGNDKLVGVISHVSGLKSQIDNKILVDKTNTGSELRIEANN